MDHTNLFYSIVFLVYGCCIGSFLNGCIWRIPRDISLVKGRSACIRCDHVLGIPDLVPILSWVVLGGRCRHCRQSIPRQYPMVELICGLMYLLCFQTLGLRIRTVLACLLGSVLLMAAVIDGKWLYVPDRVPLIILLLAIASLCISRLPLLGNRLAAAGFVCGFMLCLSILTDGGIGGGDIKLMTAGSLYLGFSSGAAAFFFSYVLAALWYLVPMVRGKLDRKDCIPMAPFFAVSIMVFALWGTRITDWYLRLLI